MHFIDIKQKTSIIKFKHNFFLIRLSIKISNYRIFKKKKFISQIKLLFYMNNLLGYNF